MNLNSKESMTGGLVKGLTNGISIKSIIEAAGGTSDYDTLFHSHSNSYLGAYSADDIKNAVSLRNSGINKFLL